MTGYFTKCPTCGRDIFYHETCQNCKRVHLGIIPQEISDGKSQKGICPRLYQETYQNCERVHLGIIPQEISDAKSQKGIGPRLYQATKNSQQ